MAKTLKERKQELELREQALREKLDLNSEGIRQKAKQVGKIALISGGVALIGFWVYKAFFESDEQDKPSKIAKKRKKLGKDISSKIATIAMPYIGKMLDSLFQEDLTEEPKKKEESHTN